MLDKLSKAIDILYALLTALQRAVAAARTKLFKESNAKVEQTGDTSDVEDKLNSP